MCQEASTLPSDTFLACVHPHPSSSCAWARSVVFCLTSPNDSLLRLIQTQYSVLFTCTLGSFCFCHVVPMGSPQAQEGKDLSGVCSLSPVLELMPDTGPWVPKCLPEVDRSNRRVFWEPWHYEVLCQARPWVPRCQCPAMAELTVPLVSDRMLFRRQCCDLKLFQVPVGEMMWI